MHVCTVQGGDGDLIQKWGVQPVYLLSSSKSMVKAGHIGHDSSFIRLGGVDDICSVEMEEKSRSQKEKIKSKVTLHLIFCGFIFIKVSVA